MVKPVYQWVFVFFASVPVLWAGSSGIDASNPYAYSENAGWLNARTSNSQLYVSFNGNDGHLSGYLWGENIGWMHFPTSGFGGVTISKSGQLSGFAWGENVGWIQFPTNGFGGVSINKTNGQFAGEAWGENIGWIRFHITNAGIRTVAFDRPGQGTPNWWLAHHGVAETSDAGDGIPAWKKYVMDVSPTNAGNGLVITSITNSSSAVVRFTPASSQRFYALRKSTNLASSAWASVPGQSRVAGTGGTQSFTDSNASANAVYAIEVQE